jgi:hypothetical protein
MAATQFTIGVDVSCTDGACGDPGRDHLGWVMTPGGLSATLAGDANQLCSLRVLASVLLA